MVFYITCPECSMMLLEESIPGLQTVCCPCGATFQILAEEGFPTASVQDRSSTQGQPKLSSLISREAKAKEETRSWIPNLVRNVFQDMDRERTRRIHKGFLTGVGLVWLWWLLRWNLSPNLSAGLMEWFFGGVLASLLVGVGVAYLVAVFQLPEQEDLFSGEKQVQHSPPLDRATKQQPDPPEMIHPESIVAVDPEIPGQSNFSPPSHPGR
ncbi:MAG: hypothetical protein U0840_04050 [Gemmataceae bacterium]